MVKSGLLIFDVDSRVIKPDCDLLVTLKIQIMHQRELVSAGPSVPQANKVIIMLHGRGSNAQSILRLADVLEIQDFAHLAPQATNYTWYPYSFLVPRTQNQPWLDSALEWLDALVLDLLGKGISSEQLYFIGFSQGACLTLEFTAQHARKYGGIVALTGGLIGDRVERNRYSGDFGGTRILITSGNPDPHIPVERVHDSVDVLKDLNAEVQSIIYDQRPHIISRDEIQLANDWIFKDPQGH